MARLRVLKGFRDLAVHADRKAGAEFEATDARAAEIERRLPGYVERLAADPVDLASLTLPKLRALALERGIAVPKGAKKEDVISLLGQGTCRS